MGKRILAVDDEKDVLEVIQEQLETAQPDHCYGFQNS